MEISPYVTFSGQCAEAFRFYEQVLGGRIVMMQTHGETPMKDHVPASWQDKILHARLEVGSFALMGSDAPPDRYKPSEGIAVSISVPASDGERIFRQLSEGGKVGMPFQKTFWAAGFGMVVDRFGTPWMVNSDR
jgi:PhnB protein